MIDKVKNLGQVFTKDKEIKLMVSLMKNNGSVLEPSAGTGNFLKHLKNVTAIEYDSSICPQGVLNIDFFDYDIINKFDTIIGNPPYVGFKEIVESTKSKLDLNKFDKRTNLHVFFIDKCMKHLKDHGEIIFVTPRDFIKQTSAIPLINSLHETGTITHFYDYGDKVLFSGFSPNCAIWRFEKDNFSRKTKLLNSKVVDQQNVGGQFVFSSTLYDYNLSDLFDVKVGGVSGMDSIFVSPNGNEEFVYSKTHTTGNTRRMYYNTKNKFLESKKEDLLKRKLKTFDESNWWMWGRDFTKNNHKRVYVNCKTRRKNPFFTHTCKNYDGSVLALFIKDQALDEQECARVLNSIDWDDLGFKVGGRYCFSQKALQNTKIPKKIAKKILDSKE
tara:strand:+ start:835 stop:1992 length:1158 start_codon:yes stop_codon:yes gene_type:complete